MSFFRKQSCQLLLRQAQCPTIQKNEIRSLRAYHTDTRNMLFQIILRKVDIGLYISEYLFQPLFTVRIGSRSADVSK